jgi:uroporphyrinogen-III decarboxylase
MNDRELFNTIMHYGAFDRIPVFHWAGWTETRSRWLSEGLPENIDENEFFGTTPIKQSADANVDLFPGFTEEVFEETEEWRVVRQPDGVIAKRWKTKSCIPHFMDFTLKGAQGWDEYKKRLQPDPRRIPADLDERISRAKNSGAPLAVNTGSMIGWIRDWMGVENLAYLCYDDRDLLKEMVQTIADLVCWGLDQVLPKFTPDVGWGWEDICFRTGPLISPDIFQEVAVPCYRQIADKLLAAGCDLYLVDCDGLVDALVPGWLEGGVNVMFPIEIGAWKADPQEYRKRFGPDLRVFGGIDKLALERGPAAIDAEIERRVPFMREGGFVPLPDHLITPGTSLENYQYYLAKMREVRL